MKLKQSWKDELLALVNNKNSLQHRADKLVDSTNTVTVQNVRL